MPHLRQYLVFISHAREYADDCHRVVQFLNDEPIFQWKYLSVPEHDPASNDHLQYEFSNRMRPADVFLIIDGMYAAHSEWTDFEVGFVRRIGRPIIRIKKWASERVPEVVSANATEIVGWTCPGLVRAIREHALAPGS